MPQTKKVQRSPGAPLRTASRVSLELLGTQLKVYERRFISNATLQLGKKVKTTSIFIYIDICIYGIFIDIVVFFFPTFHIKMVRRSKSLNLQCSPLGKNLLGNARRIKKRKIWEHTARTIAK